MIEKSLALFGGAPVRNAPLPSWPYYSPHEIELVAEVLRSGKVNYWTGGEGRLFEEEYAAYLGVAHAIACANGTVALELGLRALGIGVGDDVIVPAKTFIASASAVVAVGARPVVADIDEVSQNLTVASVQAVLTPATRAIVVVHLGGWPADMPAINSFALSKKLFVVEDCAQAHGAMIDTLPVGTFGDCAAFSFCQDKIISTGGEGGMLVFREDTAAWERAWAYKDHGKSYAAVHRQDHAPGFRWLHESFGSNMRMTEPQAAIGRFQLGRLTEWQRLRAANARCLHALLEGTPGLRLSKPSDPYTHAWYRYYAFLDLPMLRPEWDQDKIICAITAEGVPVFAGSCSEIYREKAFANGTVKAEELPIASRLSRTSLAFLVHPTLTNKDMNDFAIAIQKVMAVAVQE